MMEVHLELNSREDVIQFESQVNSYELEENGFNFNSLSLISVYDCCRDSDSGAKVFAAYLDLYLNMFLLSLDMKSAMAAWSERIGGRVDRSEVSILEDSALFFGKAEVFRFNSSFILRYRAFMDKFMGFLIICYAPDEHEKYTKAKSRRKAFRKITENISKIPKEFVETIGNHIEKFDQEYRTAEAHGTGSLRKKSFSVIPIHEDPAVKLLKEYNVLILIMDLINGLFKPINVDNIKD